MPVHEEEKYNLRASEKYGKSFAGMGRQFEGNNKTIPIKAIKSSNGSVVKNYKMKRNMGSIRYSINCLCQKKNIFVI